MLAILAGCCLSRSSGGPFESVSGLAAALADDPSIAVHVVGTFSDTREWARDQTKWSATHLSAMPSRGFCSAPALCSAILALCSDHNPRTVIHGQGLWDASSVAAAMLSTRTSLPLVISPRGMLEPWALAYRRRKKMLAWHLWQRRVLEAATLLHATSTQEAQSIRAAGLRNPVAVIPNGVRIPEVRAKAPALPRRAAHASKRCVFLSRIHEKKGLPLLIQAWAALRPKGWVLEIAGFGEPAYVATITRMIRDLGCVSIRFVGEKTGAAKADFLTDASLFILPSYSENFGVAVAEALAHGIPAITTHGMPWKILADKRLGWWIPSTTDALYAALQEATRLPHEELQQMGAAARDYANEAFSWSGVARNMAACYKWACEGGPLPQTILLDDVSAVA